MRDCSFATMFRIVDNDTLPPEGCVDFALSSPTFAGADAGGVLAGVDEVGVVEATTVVVGATTGAGALSVTVDVLDATGVVVGLLTLSLDVVVLVVGVVEFVAIVVGDV